MGFDKTFFAYFKDYCINKFGSDLGHSIFMNAENKLLTLQNEADYRNSEAIRWHMDKNMLPVISIYQAFKLLMDTPSNALKYTDEVMQITRLNTQKKNQLIGKFPFGYSLFKMFCKTVVKKQYPKQGWDIQWIQTDRKETCFHMKSCIYVETTQKYGCPELCPLFCKNDNVVLAGYKPAIVFERNRTIANGDNYCDFHFKNGKCTKKSEI